MDRKFKVATFILCIGIICFIAFELAGSSVDKEGILNDNNGKTLLAAKEIKKWLGKR